MVLNYYDGKVDERYCMGTENYGGFLHAVMVNDDYTTESVYYNDLEGMGEHIAFPIVDCPREVRIFVREKAILGHSGLFADKGDVVEVVKGRKYPKGMKMVVHEVTEGGFSNTYGHYVSPEIIFGSENGLERISADNVKVIAVKDGLQNQSEYCDVHSVAYYKNGVEVA